MDFDVLLVDPLVIGNAEQEDVLRRRSEITEFLHKGGVVFCVVQPGHLHHLLPIDNMIADAFSGTKIEFVGHPPFHEFWNSTGTLMSYKAVLRGAGTPILKITGTDKMVANWRRVGQGAVILLPALKLHSTPASRNETISKFLNGAETLVSRLRPSAGSAKQPSWSESYGWPHECKLRQRVAKVTRVAEQIEVAIAKAIEELQTEERLKVLFTGTGEALVEAVIVAFQALGATAERGVPGRDDIVLQYGDQYGVVEVKGKKSSAAERDAAQLEKWVAGYKEEHGIDAKGILVVNAYCENPLEDRTAPAFPDQMLKYSERREHCLMTSTQLLGIILSIRERKGRGKAYLNKIFSTVGVLDQFSDWHTFLQQTEIQPKPEQV